MSGRATSSLACLLILFLAGRLGSAATADLILTGARVFTASRQQPWAEAIGIRGDRIVYVGSAEGAKAFASGDTVVRDLPGKLVVPGFNDSHVHLLAGAESLSQVDLSDVEDLGEIQRRIQAFAQAHPADPWIVGSGWIYGAFPGAQPTKELLDAILPERPALLWCYDGHSAWINSKALALAGITKDTQDPPQGQIVRDPKTGDPTGMLKEDGATELVLKVIPQPDPESRYRMLVRGIKYLNAFGITSIQDAGAGSSAAGFRRSELPLLERALREGELSLRSTIALVMTEPDVEETLDQVRRLRQHYGGGSLKFGTVKAYVDGVIESKTAALLEPYWGSEEHGRPNWSPSALAAAVVAADRHDLQVYLHAIGDRAVRMALDAFEAAQKQNGPRDRRGRIEHIETIDPADYPRFAALGVIASMQPLHAEPNVNVLHVWAGNAGPRRVERAFGWRALEQAGAHLVFGSDWNVVTPDVMAGLYAAVTRRTRKDGTPADGWIPQQAVSLENALLHYTIDGAYGSFADHERGSIEVGKYADLAVLSRDLFVGSAEDILKTRVVLTLLGGRVVYESQPSP